MNWNDLKAWGFDLLVWMFTAVLIGLLWQGTAHGQNCSQPSGNCSANQFLAVAVDGGVGLQMRGGRVSGMGDAVLGSDAVPLRQVTSLIPATPGLLPDGGLTCTARVVNPADGGVPLSADCAGVETVSREFQVGRLPDGGYRLHGGEAVLNEAVGVRGNLNVYEGGVISRSTQEEGATVGTVGPGGYFFIGDADRDYLKAADGGFFISSNVLIDGSAFHSAPVALTINNAPTFSQDAQINISSDYVSNIRALLKNGAITWQLYGDNSGGEGTGTLLFQFDGIGPSAGTCGHLDISPYPNGASNTTRGWVIDKSLKTFIGPPGSINTTSCATWASAIPEQLTVVGNVQATKYIGPVTALKTASTSVDVAAATAPSSGQVLTATTDHTATWQTPAAGGSPYVISTTWAAPTVTDPGGSHSITAFQWVQKGNASILSNSGYTQLPGVTAGSENFNFQIYNVSGSAIVINTTTAQCTATGAVSVNGNQGASLIDGNVYEVRVLNECTVSSPIRTFNIVVQ